jgi:subtilisin family serine protease
MTPPAASAAQAAEAPTRAAAGRGLVDEHASRVPGQIVVKLRATVRGQDADAVRSAYGLRPVRAAASGGLQLVSAPQGGELETIRRLQSDTRVEFAEPNYVVHALQSQPGSPSATVVRPLRVDGTPDPPGSQTGTPVATAARSTSVGARECIPVPGFYPCTAPTPVARTPGCVPTPNLFACPTPVPTVVPSDPLYASSQQDMDVVGMPAAWARSVGSPAVITAVLDTGIALAHPDLSTRITSLTGPGLPGADHVFLTFADASCPTASGPDDDAWGAPGRRSHGTHVAGTIAARSTVAGDPAEGVAGMAPGTRVAPVKVLDCTGTGSSFDVAAGIAFAAANGARVINMSLGGNSFCTLTYQSVINDAHAAGVTIFAAAGNDGTSERSAPANCQYVVGVGATANDDTHASFSQSNDTVDISAPGVQITSTWRDSSGTYTYSLLSGTSMATPHAAGCAALVLSVKPELSPDQVESILRSTSVDLGTPGRDDQFGSGRLNCAAAVQLAVQTAAVTPVPPTLTPTRVPGACGSFAPDSAAGSRPATVGPKSAPPPPTGAVGTENAQRSLRQAQAVPYAASSTPVRAADASWTTVVCEDFEGAWPTGVWRTYDGNGTTGGIICWGTTDFLAYQGGHSAWPGRGCVDGDDPNFFLYGPNLDSWMVAGPFSLAGAGAAEVRFRLWHQMIGQMVGGQPDGDYLFWGASLDGTSFYGQSVTGNSTEVQPPTDQGWLDVGFDLTNVPTLGNLAGQSQVWVAWRFVSDGTALDDGPFVDDVLIRKRAAPGPTPTPTPPGSIGGRGFALRAGAQGDVVATWVHTAGETGYLGVRWSPQTGTVYIPPSGTPLPADATSYTDTPPATESAACYLVVGLGGSPPSVADVRGLSDLLCVMAGAGSGAAPADFQVQLNQSQTATLSWTPVGSPSGYVVNVVRFDGSSPPPISLPATARSTPHDTGGQATCYQLQAMNGSAVLGTTRTLCAVPGVASPAGASRLRR